MVITVRTKLAVDTQMPPGALLIALPGLAHALPTGALEEARIFLSSDGWGDRHKALGTWLTSHN